MSRHSRTLDLELDSGFKIKIGGQEVLLTSKVGDDPDKLPVKEIYVSKATGLLVIVYDDGD